MKHNCQPPRYRLSYRWPLAVDLLSWAFKADRNGRLLDFFMAQVQKAGITFEQFLLGARGVNTLDPRNIEVVLSSRFRGEDVFNTQSKRKMRTNEVPDFGLGSRSQCFRPLLGHGIFTQDGEDAMVSRKLLQPQFMETRRSFGEIQDVIENFIASISKLLSQDAVDLQPLFFRLTLNTTMAILFGRPLESMQSKHRGDERHFAEAFDHAQHVLALRGRLGDLYWIIGGAPFRRSCQTVHDFVDKIVLDALQDKKSSAGDSKDRYVFLNALIESKEMGPKAIRDQLVNILLAGRDTTACLLSWTLYVKL